MSATTSRFVRRVASSAVGALCLFALSAQAGGKLTVPEKVSFAKSADVRAAIKAECKLPERFPAYIKKYTSAYDVELGSGKGASGDVLSVEITKAQGIGGGLHGGRKYFGARGTLTSKGKVIGSFEAERGTTGGSWGGACKSLNRAAAGVAKDIGKWLEKPTNKARLGELK